MNHCLILFLGSQKVGVYKVKILNGYENIDSNIFLKLRKVK